MGRETLTRYTHGKDGKTAWHRRRGSRCARPLVPFGEKVLYLPLRTAEIHKDKGEPNMFHGIWLGSNARTEEISIGTKAGIVKCRTVKRLPEEEKWDFELFSQVQGVPWRPVPGVQGDHVPVEIRSDGSTTKALDEDGVEIAPDVAAEEDVGYNIPTQATRATDIRVSKTDIEKHDIAGGCPACKFLMAGKKIGVGLAHNLECRKRIRDLIQESDDVKDRISRADKAETKRFKEARGS